MKHCTLLTFKVFMGDLQRLEVAVGCDVGVFSCVGLKTVASSLCSPIQSNSVTLFTDPEMDHTHQIYSFE